MATVVEIDVPEKQIENVATLFKALADPARLRILNLLAHAGELCNGHVEHITGYGNSKISRHFSYLKQANLVQSRRDGLWIYYSLKPSNEPVHQWVHEIMDQMPSIAGLFERDIKRCHEVRFENGLIKKSG